MWVYFRNQRQLTLYTSNLVHKTRVPLRTQYKIHYVSCTRQCDLALVCQVKGDGQKHFQNNAQDVLEENMIQDLPANILQFMNTKDKIINTYSILQNPSASPFWHWQKLVLSRFQRQTLLLHTWRCRPLPPWTWPVLCTEIQGMKCSRADPDFVGPKRSA